MRTILLLAALLLCGSSAHAITFTLDSACGAISNAVSCTETAGDLVVVQTQVYGSSVPTFSTSDGHTTFTNNPKCGATDGTSLLRATCIGYNLSSFGGALTYTTTEGGSGLNSYTIFVEGFKVTGGPPAFDTDVACATSTNTATPIACPSITPAASGELLVAVGFPGGNITGAGGPWTGGTISAGTDIEYILSSSSGATAVDFTDITNPDVWISMAPAFGASGGGGGCGSPPTLPLLSVSRKCG